MPDVAEAKKLLDKAAEDCKIAKATADAYAKYVDQKDAAKKAYDHLDALKADAKKLVAQELTELGGQLEQATQLAENDKKPDEAIVLLKEVETKATEARVKTDMHANLHSPSPNKDYLKLLLSEPNGDKIMDDIVLGLDDTGANRKTLEAALEVRFNVDVSQALTRDYEISDGVTGTSDMTAPDKSIKKVYELMQRVPNSHTKDNPKVAEIRRYQEDEGGGSYSKAGIIRLYAGRTDSGKNHASELCSPGFFPDGVDADCQPPDDKKDADIKYFDWATLHEVGHAVDDNKNFMDTNQGKPEFGGWKVYGENVDEPAQAAQGKFKYDLAYIKSKLRDGSPGPATKPTDVDEEVWKKRQEDFDAWASIVMNLRLWWEGGNAKKTAIGGRVYQLAYRYPSGKQKWVSYDLAARSKGIHGYQFRAPGEWFAELYAAYYSGMLKPEHPAVKKWLPTDLT